MTSRFVMTAAVLIASGGTAHAQCGNHALFSMGKEDGTWISLVATDKTVTNDPAWAPGHTEPPLAPGRAYDLAVAWASANWKRFDSFQLESMDLRTIGCDSGRKKWLYVVTLAPVIEGNRLYGADYFVGVLMDGTVIPPTKGKKDF